MCSYTRMLLCRAHHNALYMRERLNITSQHSVHAGEGCLPNLNKMLLHGYVLAKDENILLFLAEVFIDWSTSPSVLRP